MPQRNCRKSFNFIGICSNSFFTMGKLTLATAKLGECAKPRDYAAMAIVESLAASVAMGVEVDKDETDEFEETGLKSSPCGPKTQLTS